MPGDVFSPVTPDSARLNTLGAPASHAPAPGFFDTIGKSFSQAGAGPDWGLNQQRWEADAISELEEGLAKQGVGLPAKPRPTPGIGELEVDRRSYVEQLLSLASRVRQADPKFLPDYAGLQHAGDLTGLVHRRRAERASSLGVELQDAGTIPWLIGSLGHGLTDPTSYIPVGGGPVGGSIARQILSVGAKEAAANAGFALASEPFVRMDASNLGIERTAGDTALDVTVQGLTGGVIGSTAKSVGVGGKAAIDRYFPADPGKELGKGIEQVVRAATWDGSRDGAFVSDLQSPTKGYAETRAAEAGTSATRDGVAAFEAAVPPGQRTPDQQAAVNVATREADVIETSPFHGGPDGQDAHVSRLNEALDALHDGRAVPDKPAPVPPPPPSAMPKRPISDTGLPADIVQFFRGKGATEAQARGIAAGIVAESRADHTIVNPTSGAFGLGQHLGSRKTELFRRYGPNPSRQQQLENLWRELTGGDHGGAKVLAASDEAGVLRSYIEDFMRPAKGAETSGDLERGMAALGRGEEAAPFADNASTTEGARMADASPAEEAFANVRPDALGETSIAGMILDGQPVPLDFARFRPDQLEIDAGLMQFKHGGDAMGVTDRYARVDRWNPGLADPIIVWESKGGRRIVADGHQRHGIARRSLARYPDHPVEMTAFVMREGDGYSARDARLFAAFRNVAQGHGGPLDFAKLLPETGGVLPVGIDAAAADLRDARGIVKLQGAARALAFAEQVRPDFAGLVGNLMPGDEGRQVALMQLLMETQPANLTQATSIVRDGIAAGFHDGTQLEMDLFGGTGSALSKLKKRAQVLDAALTELNKRKLVFSTVERNSDMIEAAGSSIDRNAAGKEAQANAQALELIARLASRAGPVKDALDAAVDARILGVSRADAARRFADDVAKLDLDAIASADRAAEGGPAGGDGDGLGAERYAVDAAARDAGASEGNGDPAIAEAVAAADAEAAGQAKLFDDPAGPAAKEQAELIRHDAAIIDDPEITAMLAEIDEEKAAAAELRACLNPGA